MKEEKERFTLLTHLSSHAIQISQKDPQRSLGGITFMRPQSMSPRCYPEAGNNTVRDILMEIT